MKKALVVDDELDICRLLTLHLKALGLDAEYVSTIGEAKTRISPAGYDVIFVDLNLPDGSGFDLLESLNLIHSTSRVIVISAYDVERKKALESGADGFIPKPFSKRTIELVLNNLQIIN
jgi:DNA-binding response OmpR family regulator